MPVVCVVYILKRDFAVSRRRLRCASASFLLYQNLCLIVSYRIVSLYLSGLAGIGEATAFGGREGLGHRFAAAWARVRAASGDG